MTEKLMTRRYHHPKYRSIAEIRIKELGRGFEFSLTRVMAGQEPRRVSGENGGDFEEALRKIKDILDGFFSEERPCKPKPKRKRTAIAQLTEPTLSEHDPESLSESTTSLGESLNKYGRTSKSISQKMGFGEPRSLFLSTASKPTKRGATAGPSDE